jgi:phosphopantothenoylcysteine decarboxylase/phosphopantothenoylcysteine decarboxylase/phosphopantothenate--cysteine ligase
MSKNILLGVTGSIAAYKAADIANILTKDGYNVEVILTRAGREFITPLTFQTLTKNRVHTDLFDEKYPSEVLHISLAKKADLLLIAPASADIIGKISNGIADDMLSTVALAVHEIPVYIAPAMNTHMLENPIVQENIKKLIRCGYHIVESREGRLACGDLGRGALAEVSEIIAQVESQLQEGRKND